MTTTNESQSRNSTSNSSKLSVPSGPSPSLNSQNTHNLTSTYQPSRFTEASNRPHSAVTASTSIESHLQETPHARPVSAYTTFGSSSSSTSASFSDPLKPPEYFARPDSATSSVLNLPSTTSALGEQSSTTFHERPETAILYDRPDTAEAALPPRRELPFTRFSAPHSSGSDSAQPSSRPSTSLMGPPPLPARVANLRPSSSRTASQDTELPPLPKPTVLDTAQQQPSWMQQPPRTPNQDHIATQGAPTPTLEEQENRPYSNPSPGSSGSSPLSFNRPSSSMLSPNRPINGLSSDAQHQRRSTSLSPLSTPTTMASPSTEKGFAPDGSTVAAAVDNLAAYAMQPAEGRRAALNEFIFQHLEDENFITLLEDVETCWARTGLGMK